MRKIIQLIFVLFLLPLCVFAQNDGEDIVIGKYHVINSKILGEERRILVHLPLGYEETKLQYPVVYHLYGDFVMTYFADAASVMERMHDEGKIPQMILIGVDNTDRYRDLRPVKNDGSPGGSENFINYFKEELIPFVINNFRTEDYNILVGPQAGACFGLYALTEHADLFDAFILENSFDNPPEVDKYLISHTKSFFMPDKSLNKFLFMKVKKESSNLQIAMEQKSIIESGIPKDFRFEFRLNDSENDIIPSTDIKYGFMELFSGYELPYETNMKGLDDILEYYQQFSNELGFSVNISDRILRSAANRFNSEGNKQEVQRIWEYVLRIYPRSLDGLFQVAEMRASAGRFKEAKEYYTKFLEIRPQEAFIQNRFKNIEKFIDESAVFEIEQAILGKGLKNGKEVYQQLKKDSQNTRYFREDEFIQMGYRFINTNKLIEAIEVFKMSVELFPESFNTWDSLGEAYMKKGDNKLATQNYEKSLELNPDNSNARKMLELLGKQ